MGVGYNIIRVEGGHAYDISNTMDERMCVKALERGYRDTMLMERLWRSYKWECVYLREKVELKELKEVTKEWVEYYNKERPHQSLGYKTPDEVYYGEVSKGCHE